jgi:hypothetical protein
VWVVGEGADTITPPAPTIPTPSDSEGGYTLKSLSTHPVVALKERRQRLQQQAQAASQVQASLVHQLDQLGLRCAARAIHDSRTADEILGYDATGLPS